MKDNKDRHGSTVGQAIRETSVPSHYTVKTEVFQVIENNHGNVIGKQSQDQK